MINNNVKNKLSTWKKTNKRNVVHNEYILLPNSLIVDTYSQIVLRWTGTNIRVGNKYKIDVIKNYSGILKEFGSLTDKNICSTKRILSENLDCDLLNRTETWRT